MQHLQSQTLELKHEIMPNRKIDSEARKLNEIEKTLNAVLFDSVWIDAQWYQAEWVNVAVKLSQLAKIKKLLELF